MSINKYFFVLASVLLVALFIMGFSKISTSQSSNSQAYDTENVGIIKRVISAESN